MTVVAIKNNREAKLGLLEVKLLYSLAASQWAEFG